MDFALFFLAFTMFWEISNAIQCYRCVPEKIYNGAGVPECQYFDGSPRFIVDCPSSTGCIKKDTLLISLGVKITERGCALQVMDGEQEKINGRWQHVTKIYEAYDVGCKEDSNENNKPTKTTLCFCRGDLCNAAAKNIYDVVTTTSGAETQANTATTAPQPNGAEKLTGDKELANDAEKLTRSALTLILVVVLWIAVR